MVKMHENELEIDECFVRTLLQEQRPQWINLPLQRITSSGTDNALYRLGTDFIVRLPRIEWEPGSINKNINKEYDWLPKIAQFLKTPISEPLFKGKPANHYPFDWLVVRWNEGHNPVFEKDNEYEFLAKDLAHFLNDFHEIKLPHGPFSRRGVPLIEIDEDTRNALGKLQGEIDIPLITHLWDQLIDTPPWNKDFVWIHGDFLPGNILVQNNRLSGVIDFSDVGIGDPACDLIIAWALFNSHSRKIFKDNLKNIDDNTWKRGRGWALSIALMMLPYYKNTNPMLAMLARRIIENVQHDQD